MFFCCKAPAKWRTVAPTHPRNRQEQNMTATGSLIEVEDYIVAYTPRHGYGDGLEAPPLFHTDRGFPEDDEEAGVPVLWAEPHPDPAMGGMVIRNIPDETVPLVDHLQLAAKVEHLSRQVDSLNKTLGLIRLALTDPVGPLLADAFNEAQLRSFDNR